MPMAISFVGASIIWKFVYDYRDPSQPQIGLLSQVVHLAGLEEPAELAARVSRCNTFLLMVIMVWIQVGFAMVVLSAAIKAIPGDVIEAARARRGDRRAAVQHRDDPDDPQHPHRGAHDDPDRGPEDLRHRPDHHRRQLRAPTCWPTRCTRRSSPSSTSAAAARSPSILFLGVDAAGRVQHHPAAEGACHAMSVASGEAITRRRSRAGAQGRHRPRPCGPRSARRGRRRSSSSSPSCGRSRPSACSSPRSARRPTSTTAAGGRGSRTRRFTLEQLPRPCSPAAAPAPRGSRRSSSTRSSSRSRRAVPAGDRLDGGVRAGLDAVPGQRRSSSSPSSRCRSSRCRWR